MTRWWAWSEEYPTREGRTGGVCMPPELVTCIECGNEQTHRVCADCFAASLPVEPATDEQP